MTPKEKAKELFTRFMKPVDPLNKYPMCFDTTKQCALIAVDEVISIKREFLYDENEYMFKLYWQEVKQEIENL